MAVFVDPLREYPHVPFAVRRWCHMVCDGGFEELHAFAAQLGMPRARFQGDHYDLPPWVLERAVALRPDFWWAAKVALPVARRPIDSK